VGGDRAAGRGQQKISGRLRSEETTRHRYRIASCLSTAAKNGINTLQAIRDGALAENLIRTGRTSHESFCQAAIC
jgi:hypothetical protein